MAAPYTAQGFIGPSDQFRTSLGQYLDGHIVRDEALFDDLADEVEIGLRRAGKPTSISLNPILSSMSNMRRLRAASMGSISA